MFASRSFGALQRPNSLDMPVAALAGLAVAFIAFAAPADLLANLVSASGLPSILPAAEPPLGFKARIVLGAGGALVAFGIAMLVLRWLGRFGARRAEEAEAATELEVPRLRRRDIHPDAPARPPLLAVHELGEPELELTQVEVQVEPEPIAAPQPQPQPSLAAAPSQPPLLARKPDRLAEPHAPASFEPEMPATPKPPAEEEQNEQAQAYALSQRNWADFDPEPQNGTEPDRPWLAEPAFEAEPKWEVPSSPSLPESVTAVEPVHAAEPVEPEPVESPQSDWQAEPMAGTEPAFETEPGWGTTSSPPWPAEAVEAVEPAEPENRQSDWTTEPAPESEPVFETEPLWETRSSSAAPWPAEPEAFEPDQPASRQSVWSAEPAPEAEPEWEQAAAPIEPEWEQAAAPVEPEWEQAAAPVEPEWEQAAAPVEPWPAPRAVAIEPEPPLPEPEPQAEPISAPQIVEGAPHAHATGSIAELMERLEKGLARHRTAPTASAAPAPAATAAPVRSISPDPADDRLQNAIESLQRFASRQD